MSPTETAPDILIIDDQDRFLDVIQRGIKGSSLTLSAVDDIRHAKRSLLQSPPQLILCAGSFLFDESAGYNFCAELQGHEALQNIPVLLIVEDLNEEAIHRASSSGAKGAIAWPSSAEAFRNRLRVFFPDLKNLSAAVSSFQIAESSAGKSQDQNQEQSADQKGRSEAISPGDDLKIQRAQQILARVLHNLKTSHVLAAADMEDVPRILLEITRSVCGIPSESASSKAVEKKSDASVDLDLDRVFGRKK